MMADSSTTCNLAEAKAKEYGIYISPPVPRKRLRVKVSIPSEPWPKVRYLLFLFIYLLLTSCPYQIYRVERGFPNRFRRIISLIH